MVDLASLWLPILLSVVGVFIASSIVWMALPFHKKEYRQHEKSEEVADWIRRNRPVPGRYMVGWCAPGKEKEKDPATLSPTSPRGLLLVQYGSVGMGKNLGLWALHLAIVSVLVGYIATLSVARGAPCAEVLRVTFTTSLLAYGGGALPKAIWEGIPWSHVPAAILDAVVYAAVTGAVFCAFWPGA